MQLRIPHWREITATEPRLIANIGLVRTLIATDEQENGRLSAPASPPSGAISVGTTLWVGAFRPGAIIVGTACHLLRSEPPMIAVRYSYLPARAAMQLLGPLHSKGGSVLKCAEGLTSPKEK